MLSPPLAHPQLLANAVIFLCGNLTGAFHKHHMQDASRELFTYTVKCIQIRRKLRIEKRQQVRSLPSLGATAWPSQAPRPTSFLSAHHTLTEQHVHGAHGWTPMPASPQGPPGTREAVCLAGLVAGRRPAELEGTVGSAGRNIGETGQVTKPGA